MAQAARLMTVAVLAIVILLTRSILSFRVIHMGYLSQYASILGDSFQWLVPEIG
jgi:hypothetical protein